MSLYPWCLQPQPASPIAYLLQLVENDAEVFHVIHRLRDGSKVVFGGGRAEAAVELARGGVVEGEGWVADGDLCD